MSSAAAGSPAPQLERDPGLLARLVRTSQQLQRGGQIDVRDQIVAVELDRLAVKRNRLLIVAGKQLG